MEKVVPITADIVMTNINKKQGAGTIIKATDAPRSVPRLPFGVFVATYGSGGGAPIWCATRLRGAEGSGKTTMALSAMKQASLMCWRCFNMASFCTCSQPALRMKSLYIDAEGALDPEWIDALGIPRDTFYILRTAEGNEALTAAEAMLKADDIGLVVIDSIAHLLPAVEMERPIGEKMVASLASLITHAVVKLQVRMNTEEARGHPCAVIATNQLRFIIGAGLYANPETESGGQSFKHWFSLGMRMSKLSTSDSLLSNAEKREVKTYQRHGIRWDKERFSTFLGAAEFLRAREDIYDVKNPDNLLYTKGSVIDDMVIEKYLKRFGMVGDGSWAVPGIYDDVKLQKELRAQLRKNDERYYQLHIEITRRAKEHGCRNLPSMPKPDGADEEGYDIPI